MPSDSECLKARSLSLAVMMACSNETWSSPELKMYPVLRKIKSPWNYTVPRSLSGFCFRENELAHNSKQEKCFVQRIFFHLYFHKVKQIPGSKTSACGEETITFA